MKFSTTALATVLAAMAAASPAVAADSWAQPATGRAPRQPAAAAAAQPGERRRDVSPAEQRALQPLLAAAQAAQAQRTAGQTPDYTQVRALLPAAVAAARGNDAKYLVARVQLSMASSPAEQQPLITTLLANPVTPPEEQAQLRASLDAFKVRAAEAAFNSQNFQEAARLFGELAAAHPENEAYRNNLAIIQRRLGNSAPLRDNVLQNIRTAEAAGRPAAETDYRNALALANEARDLNGAIDWAAKLAQNYPNNPENWRAAIAQARLRGGDDIQYVIDIYRLAQRTNSLRVSPQVNEYLGLANQLSSAGLVGEARAVLQAGLTANALQGTTPTGSGPTVAAAIAAYQARAQRDQAGLAGEVQQARSAPNGRYARNIGDTYYGLGRYAEAVEMYRLAQTKGGEDAALINTRIGMSLALAGQRAEAETAFRAATGPRADLAKLWLAWLARRTG